MYIYISIRIYIELEIDGFASLNANHFFWGNCESL